MRRENVHDFVILVVVPFNYNFEGSFFNQVRELACGCRYKDDEEILKKFAAAPAFIQQCLF